MVSFSWLQWLQAASPLNPQLKARKRVVSQTLKIETLEDRALLSANLPIAVDDAFYSINEDTPLVAATVLSNDTDADVGDTIDQAILSTDVQHGTLTLNLDGTFSYAPAANFHGEDTFTYFARDSVNGEQSATAATVTITVNPVNDTPVADALAFSTNEDTQFAGTLTGSDIEAQALAFALGTPATNGTATVNPDSSFTYLPNANFHGNDSFTFLVNDGASSSIAATVTITVDALNDAPVATPATFTTGIDAQVNGTLGGTDAEENPITFALSTAATNGTATVNTDGTFSYQPNVGFHGVDTFTFIVNDGTSDSLPVTVTIVVNTLPVADPLAFSTDEDTPHNGTLTGSDADSDPITFVLGTAAEHGTATVNADGTFNYVPNANYQGTDTFTFVTNDGLSNSLPVTVTITVNAVNDTPIADTLAFSTDEDTTLNGTLTGSDVDIQTLTFSVGQTVAAHGTVEINADGTFTYVPMANFKGTDTFSFKVSDGTATSIEATVTVTVNSINDAPVVFNDMGETPEEDLVDSVSSSGFDADGDALTYAVVTQPAHGTLAFSPDGTFTYTPEPGYNGLDTFSFKANDGTVDSNVGTFNISVLAVEDPLTLTLPSGEATVAKNRASVQIDPAASVSDPDTTVDFTNASIEASILSGNLPADTKSRVKLVVQTQGTGAGQVKVRGKNVFFDGSRTAVAKITGGKRGAPLVITFNSGATEDAVNAVLKQLSIQATKKASSGPRSIGVTVTAGGQTAQATQTAVIS